MNLMITSFPFSLCLHQTHPQSCTKTLKLQAKQKLNWYKSQRSGFLHYLDWYLVCACG